MLTKKNIINSVDFVFISSETIAKYNTAKNDLQNSNVNSKLLDCSDAHNYSTEISTKDRIGKCFTWIKADTSFEGLKQVLLEFDERCFVGDKPDILKRMESNPGKFIKSVRIEKQTSTFSEHWFTNVDISINSGLVAIIGNKGSGKSALADILGLLGNTKNHKHFSFLNAQKFCHPKAKKANSFRAFIKWNSGQETERRLDDFDNLSSIERIKYIPQGYFETICNEIQIGENGNFYSELQEVIFSHVEDSESFGCKNLNELIDYKTNEIEQQIQVLRNEIQVLNIEIVDCESQLDDDYERGVESSLREKEEQLRNHEKTKPIQIEIPSVQSPEQVTITTKINQIRANQIIIEEEISKKKRELRDAKLNLETISRIEKQFLFIQEQYLHLKESTLKDLESIGLDFSEVISWSFNLKKLNDKKTELNQKIAVISTELDPIIENSFTSNLNKSQSELLILQDSLEATNRKYQTYIESLRKWENTKNEIVGSEDTPSTILYFRKCLDNTTKIPETLKILREKRAEKSKLIFRRIEHLVIEYKKLYKAVQNFIQFNPIASDIDLQFDVSIIESGFHDSFLSWINRTVSGSFREDDTLPNLLNKTDFNDCNSVVIFLNTVIEHLENDCRKPNNDRNRVKILNQLRGEKKDKLNELYDYIFLLSYLKPRFTLKLGKQELNELSPGQKGALLLIFYLLIDKNDIPLLIDQPEENLDNQSVFNFLVKSIKDAKKRRQIIIVTHNPNLAVVCDADQVIHARIHKTEGYRVEYYSGAIENPDINKRIVDVLEGTRPAFENRSNKYSITLT